MKPHPDAFAPAALERALTRLAQASGTTDASYVAAVSGGQDSLALAHALAQLDLPARAVYVDHGLHVDSAAWGCRVAAALEPLGLPTRCVRVTVADGGNLEARARAARYAALAAQLAAGEVLLTAHHRDDQALTVLLQLLRGAGVAGLAAMPARAVLGAGLHWRPLLDTAGAALADYAARAGLDPVTDPSNADRRFDRNYLRHEIAPLLAARWPAYARTLSRSAGHCAQTLAVLAEHGAPIVVDDAVWLGAPLSRAAATSALRLFLRERAVAMPAAARVDEFVRQVCEGAPDAQPELALRDTLLRRYGGWVFAVEAPLADTAFDLPLEAGTTLLLPGAAGQVAFSPDASHVGRLRVCSRRGGERFGAAPSRRLKHFFNERRVLPWRRPSVPLVYRGEELVAIGDFWQSARLGGRFEWQHEAAFVAPQEPVLAR